LLLAPAEPSPSGQSRFVLVDHSLSLPAPPPTASHRLLFFDI
jgi:hypothetical protein